MFAEISPELFSRWTFAGRASSSNLPTETSSVSSHTDLDNSIDHHYLSQDGESREEIDGYVDIVAKIARIDSTIAAASSANNNSSNSSSSCDNGDSKYDLEHRYLDRGGFYHIGAERLYCVAAGKRSCRCFQLLVRPDVSEDALLSLSEALLLSSAAAGNKQRIVRQLPPVVGYHCTEDTAIAGTTTAVQRTATVVCSSALTAGTANLDSTQQQQQLWSSIRVLLSVNMQLQRCLVLYITPSDFVRGTIGALNGSSKAFSEFSSDLISRFQAAMDEEKFTLRHIIDNNSNSSNNNMRNNINNSSSGSSSDAALSLNPMFAAPEAATATTTTTTSTIMMPRRAVDSVLDLSYIRDLQAACAQRMVLLLRHEAAYFDNHVKLVEQQCARLMTLLSSTYKRSAQFLESLPQLPTTTTTTAAVAAATATTTATLAAVAAATVTSATSAATTTTTATSATSAAAATASSGGGKSILAQYPLQLERSSIELVRTEEIKLLLLRARKRFRKQQQQQQQQQQFGVAINSSSNGNSNSNNSNYSNSNDSEFIAVHNDIKNELLSWAQQEFVARLRRKLQYVRDRVQQIQQFRLQLVLTLHQRYVTHGDFYSGFETANSSLRSNADRLLQLAVRQKFCGLVDIEEPTIIDCPAVVNGRSGVLYVTLRNILFYGSGGFLIGSPEILVVSLKTVETLEMVDREGNFYSYQYHPQLVNLELASQNASLLDDTAAEAHSNAAAAVVDDDDADVDATGHGGDDSRVAATPISAVDIEAATATVQTTPSAATTTAVEKEEQSISQLLSMLNALRLVDNFGQRESLIRIKGPTPDFTNRLTDLLDLIIKNQLHWLKLSPSHATPPSTATATGTSTGSDTGNATNSTTAMAATDEEVRGVGLATVAQRSAIDDIDDIMSQLDASIAAMTQVQINSSSNHNNNDNNNSNNNEYSNNQNESNLDGGIDMLEFSAGLEDIAPTTTATAGATAITTATAATAADDSYGTTVATVSAATTAAIDVESKQLQELSSFFSTDETVSSNNDSSTAAITTVDNSTHSNSNSSSTATQEQKKSRAGNIQKFLQQSQQQKK